MKEFFDPLPPNTPTRLSPRYLERLERAIERSSLGPQNFSNFGGAGNSPSGPWQYIEPQSVIFAIITASPSGLYTGYSWMQQSFDVEGAFLPATPMLRGDNGSQGGLVEINVTNVSRTDNIVELSLASSADELFPGETVAVADVDGAGATLNGAFTLISVNGINVTYYLPGTDIAFAAVGAGTLQRPGRQRSSPAFDPNGAEDVGVGTIVALAKGRLHTSAVSASSLTLIDPDDPDSGVTTDSEATVNQEWIIVGGVGGSPNSNRRIRVTGAGIVVDTYTVYPGVLDLYDDPTEAFEDGSEVWLRSRQAATLSTDGSGIYHSILENPRFDSGTDIRPLWVTRDRPYVTNVECIAGNIVVTTDGPVTTSTPTPVTIRLLDLIPDDDDVGVTEQNADTIDAALVDFANPASVYNGVPLALPPGTSWLPDGSPGVQIGHAASGLEIRAL